jgi:hypothetical protein
MSLFRRTALSFTLGALAVGGALVSTVPAEAGYTIVRTTRVVHFRRPVYRPIYRIRPVYVRVRPVYVASQCLVGRKRYVNGYGDILIRRVRVCG